MMGSAPLAGEQQVYALLALIADPAGAKSRLDELSRQSAELAVATEQAAQANAQALAEARDAQAGADSDQAAASKALLRANDLLAANQIQESSILNKLAEIQAATDNLSAARKDLTASAASQRAEFDAREKDLATREAAIADLTAQAQADAEIAAKLRSDLEGKLAQLKALAS